MSIRKIHRRDTHNSLIRSTSIMSLGTLASRILGFLRDIVLATVLGTAAMADAFFVAFKIPNLLRDIVGEGATNSAFVPVFSEYLEQKKRKDWLQFTSVMLVILLIILVILTVLGIWLAPWIVRLMAPGFMEDPAKLESTVSLTRWMFPYLILIGLTAYSTGILVAMRSFVAPAFTPCMMNVALIASAVIATQSMETPVYGLAIGVLIGGVLQLVFQWPPLRKRGVRFVKPATLRDSGAARVGKLLIPRIWGSAVYQSTVLVDTFCASLAMIVGAGGISAIYYSNRIIQFPLGVFGIALASAVLPTFSGMVARNDTDQLKKTLIFTLENIAFVLVPSAVLLILFSQPLIRVLFERGEFNAYSTSITASAVMFYALGLPAYGGIKILVSAFHAMHDTKTPVIAAGVCLVVNVVLNFLLMYPFKIGGITLASSIAGTIDFFILFYLMEKRLGGLKGDLTAFFVKTLGASIVMGGAVFWSWSQMSMLNEFVKLIVVGIEGYMLFWFVCWRLEVPQAVVMWNWLKGERRHGERDSE